MSHKFHYLILLFFLKDFKSKFKINKNKIYIMYIVHCTPIKISVFYFSENINN